MGGVEALQDGAVSIKGTHALADLVADVAGVDVGEDEGVGMAGHLGVRALGYGHTGRNGGVELQLAVHVQVGGQSLQLVAGVAHFVHVLALAGTKVE